ncbi:MAG: cytochrome c maturation protein CcmE [Chloroflexota bacterium]
MAMTHPTQPLAPRPARANASRWKLLAAMVTIVICAAYLVTTSMQTSAVYYLTVSELRARESAVQAQSVRVAGKVAPGSVEKIDGGLAIHFIVHDDGGSFPVYYSGAPVPDIFGEDVEVVVEGKLREDGTFVAHTLLAKCASKFEA